MTVRMAMCKCGEPLISTHAFCGAEFWCGVCGKQYGFLDAPRKDVQDDMVDRKEELTMQTAEYREAVGTLNCAAKKINGALVMRDKIPQKYLDDARDVIKKWENKQND